MTNSEPTPPSPVVGYVEKLIATQDARKASLEQRGSAVITTSGSVATLLFGLVALLTQSEGFELPRQAHGPIGTALAALVVACVLSLGASVPAPYIGLKITDPTEQLRNLSAKSSEDAQILVTSTQMSGLKRAKHVNDLKAWVVVAAVAAEVAGIVAIGLAVREVLIH